MESEICPVCHQPSLEVIDDITNEEDKEFIEREGWCYTCEDYIQVFKEEAA